MDFFMYMLIGIAVVLAVVWILYMSGLLETIYFWFWYRFQCKGRSDYEKLWQTVTNFRHSRIVPRLYYFDRATEKIMMKASDRSEGKGMRKKKKPFHVSFISIQWINPDYSLAVRVRCRYKKRVKPTLCNKTDLVVRRCAGAY